MVKTKFSKLDIRRVSLELDAKLSGYWVNNVYDVDSKTFLLKLTMPGKEKETVVIESGVRFHQTKFVKEKSDVPSGFSMKLRKHIRQKRLISIKQFGEDRVVDFTFGLYDKEDSQYHIIVEMYAQGNVVLTDHTYRVLSLIRVFKDDEVRFAVGENYVQAIKKSVSESEKDTGENKSKDLQDVQVDTATLHTYLTSVLNQSTSKETSGKKGKEGAPSLKQALSNRNSVVNVLGPDLIEHCILLAGQSPSRKVSEALLSDVDSLTKLAESLVQNSKDFVLKLSDLAVKAGFLVIEGKKHSGQDDASEPVFYDRFDGLLLEQHKGSDMVEFDSLNDAVDEFFSKIEAQRQEKAILAKRKQAAKKVESIKADQAKRIESLKKEILMKERGAEAISNNLENVDRAILIVRSAVASGMDWVALDELIETEKDKGNPIAQLIEKTNFSTNEIVLRLPIPEGLQEGRDKYVSVGVDINLSAFANVSALYSNKKQAASKAERTVEAAEKVLEDAEKKFRKELEKQEKGRAKVQVQRKINWFEKFNWFITSEGLLVISGRDAQQNELIVKKFLRKSHGDIYVHADLHGASTCVVRSPRPGFVIPPESLRQAGAMTVCQSSAWNAKIITSAWWVHAEQVSKTAPTGEYLSTGSFMIRGKKNFLPPCRLELTFGIIFKLDETQESFDNRKLDWRVQEAISGDPQPTKHDQVEQVEQQELETNEEDAEEANEQANEQQEDALSSELEQPKKKKAQSSELEQSKKKPEHGKDQEEDASSELEKPRRATKKPPAKADGKNGKQQDVNNAPKSKSGGKIPRGKRGKLKKMKKKYQNQTEEDRRLAMLALGHQIDDDDEHEDLEVEDEEDNNSTDVAPDEDNEASAESRKKGKTSTARPPKPPRAADDDDVDDELNLKSFTFNPQPDDIILYALPFCSPPQATMNYKYRIKLTPGPLKKGKASKQAQEVMLRQPNGTDRERDLIRACPDNDLVRAMQGMVKITAPGVNNVSKAAKAAKQAKRIKKPRK